MKMLNAELDPLQKLIIAYAKQKDRERYALVFALDMRLADIIRSSSEILIAQMKLTWWRDILTKPAADRPSGEPLVAAINKIESEGVALAPLLTLIDGWEFALEDLPWGDRELTNFAKSRGEAIFLFASGSLSNNQKIAAQCWSLWDFARHCSNAETRERAFQKTTTLSQSNSASSFDRSGRPLSILCKLMERDVNTKSLAKSLYRPKTAVRIIWHGISGL